VTALSQEFFLPRNLEDVKRLESSTFPTYVKIILRAMDITPVSIWKIIHVLVGS
jgi:hypothetical protein